MEERTIEEKKIIIGAGEEEKEQRKSLNRSKVECIESVESPSIPAEKRNSSPTERVVQCIPPPGTETQKEEQSYSMADVLKSMLKQEAIMDKLLKLESMKKCTYDKGYIRQQVFACRTCYVNMYKEKNPKGNIIDPNGSNVLNNGEKKQILEVDMEEVGIEPAGFCIGCSMNCHLDHDIYELYDKRAFRCDCGNYKYRDSCQLNADKDHDNPKNTYSSNYFGKYCYCKEAYDENCEDIMFKCLHCENWFHGLHLKPPRKEDVGEYDLICRKCLEVSLPFLPAYYICIENNAGKRILNEERPPTSPKNLKRLEPECGHDHDHDHNHNHTAPPHKQFKPSEESKIDSVVVDTNTDPLKTCTKPREIANNNCVSDILLPSGWIKVLCNCPECIQMYAALGISSFLQEYSANIGRLSETDQIHDLLAYDGEGETDTDIIDPFTEVLDVGTERLSLYDLGLKRMNGIPHQTLMNIIHGYKNLINSFHLYFHKFAGTGHVITPQNIQEFFEHLKDSTPQSEEWQGTHQLMH